jgi:hypothetical protein
VAAVALGMAIWVQVSDTRWVLDLTGTDTRMIFYLWVTLVPDLNLDGYFFHPTSTRYFTTAIILDCEQVKMCLFYYINYDLF